MIKFSVLALAAFSVVSAHAGLVAINGVSGGQFAGPASDQMYGWFFTTSESISVTDLGVYDQDGDGLTESHDVGIFRVSDESLVGFATVPAGTGGTLLNGWRYTPVTPFLLTADSYAIVMTMLTDSPDGQIIFADGVGTSADVTWIKSAFGNGTTLTYPDDLSGPFGIAMFGPNFQFNAPEPGSALLFAAGGLALAFIRRRKA